MAMVTGEICMRGHTKPELNNADTVLSSKCIVQCAVLVRSTLGPFFFFKE
jgi:hypothetical protein